MDFFKVRGAFLTQTMGFELSISGSKSQLAEEIRLLAQKFASKVVDLGSIPVNTKFASDLSLSDSLQGLQAFSNSNSFLGNLQSEHYPFFSSLLLEVRFINSSSAHGKHRHIFTVSTKIRLT